MRRDADFSPCRRYRYALWRSWADLPEDDRKNYVLFIGLNPSTADESVDDPTIRRCIGFARDWGFSSLCMANIFAFRATQPQDMFAAEDPVGPETDVWLQKLAQNAGLVVAAWGVHGRFLGRDLTVQAKMEKLYCLRQTKAGFPAHPLYLPKNLKPVLLSRST